VRDGSPPVAVPAQRDPDLLHDDGIIRAARAGFEHPPAIASLEHAFYPVGVRWDNLRLDTERQDDRVTLPLFEQGAVVRTFDTPEFRGMTFYEVRARSIINRVPEASRVPFRWTINPYRGCSHACTYCLSGDTPILMGDGRTKPLGDVRPGDRVYGTVVEGRYRRYVVTDVLDHWRTVKPAYRVSLEDGTELIASGDHRFLTERGWKHVTSDRCGARPSLIVDDRLVGLGRSLEHALDARTPALAGAVAAGRRSARLAPQLADSIVSPKAELRVVGIEPLGVELPMFDITTGTGDFIANGVISHNCFARNTHTYLDMDFGEDFDSRVVVKVNAPEVLRKELARPRWAGEHIAMGTNVDPYQRAEGRYRLMRGIIEALRDFANPFSILTKGKLILRDLDLLRQAAEVTDVATNFSVGFIDEGLWRTVEPGTPRPSARLEAVHALNDAGIPTGVLMAPILPYVTDHDEQLEATVKAIAEAGATHVSPIVLHLRTGAREWYLRWLEATRPDLVGRYRDLYGRGAYAPKAYQAEVAAKVHDLARKYRVGASTPQAARRVRPSEPPEPEQLSIL
jgi:DNA repair photolyase